MVKTIRKRLSSKSKTKKNKKLVGCPIGLKPFENALGKRKSGTHIGFKYYKTHHKFVSELMAKFAPGSIKPNNDFYDYINYQWLKNVSLKEQQKYIVQVDDFRLTQDKVYRQLDEIILNYIKTHNDKLAKNLKNFYNSILTMNSLSYSKKIAKESEKIVENLIRENNPWKMLAYMNKDEMISFRAPFVWSINPDDKNTKRYSCYITPHQFTLLDLSVYYDDGKDVEYKKKYRNKYFEYCKNLFHTILGPNHYNPKDIYDVEVDIFNSLGCIDVTSKEEKTYNKVMAEESLKKYGFDWHEFSKQLGFKQTPDFFYYI